MGPFQGSLTNLGASGRLQSQIQAILGQILTVPDPPCQLGQIFMVRNGLCRCPTYSTTYFMFNSHLWGGILGPVSFVSFGAILAVSGELLNAGKNTLFAFSWKISSKFCVLVSVASCVFYRLLKKNWKHKDLEMGGGVNRDQRNFTIYL